MRKQRTHRGPGIVVFTLLAASLWATGCSTNPATGKRQVAFIGEEQEVAMGRAADQQVAESLGLYDDAELQQYVNRLGQQLARESERPNLPWTFRVVDDPVVNAFALPGGYIYVTRGLLSYLSTEAELVSVLGHEIGHVTGRHSVEQMSKQQLAQIGMIAGMVLQPELANYSELAQTGLGLMFLKYGRDDEREADDLGLRYMVRENYDPREMPDVFATLGRASQQQGAGRIPGWLSSHPAPEERIQRIQEQIAALDQDFSGRTVNRAAYLDKIDGIAFGQDPREGYFRGSTFVHPELAFQIQFPPGWKASNQKQAVGAVSPGKDAVVVLTQANSGSPQDAARQFYSQQGIQQGPAVRANLGGGALANVFGVSRSQGGDIQGVAAFVKDGNAVYRILGYTMANNFQRYGDELASAIGSFSRVTDRRLLDVQPRRVDVVKITRAMSLEEFNRRHSSTVDIQTLAIINQADGNTRFPAGTEVKRVVGGEGPS